MRTNTTDLGTQPISLFRGASRRQMGCIDLMPGNLRANMIPCCRKTDAITSSEHNPARLCHEREKDRYKILRRHCSAQGSACHHPDYPCDARRTWQEDSLLKALAIGGIDGTLEKLRQVDEGNSPITDPHLRHRFEERKIFQLAVEGKIEAEAEAEFSPPERISKRSCQHPNLPIDRPTTHPAARSGSIYCGRLACIRTEHQFTRLVAFVFPALRIAMRSSGSCSSP